MAVLSAGQEIVCDFYFGQWREFKDVRRPFAKPSIGEHFYLRTGPTTKVTVELVRVNDDGTFDFERNEGSHPEVYKCEYFGVHGDCIQRKQVHLPANFAEKIAKKAGLKCWSTSATSEVAYRFKVYLRALAREARDVPDEDIQDDDLDEDEDVGRAFRESDMGCPGV